MYSSPVVTPLELLDRFFYNWPKNDPKPPAAWRPITEEIDGKEELSGIEIQLAVAGFKEEDLKVYQQGRKLIVEGDNSHRDEVDVKWKSQFKKEISLQEKLDLDSAKVDLFDGILSIKVPLFKSLREKKYLLGKKE
jgi:HSP20 family molecular chaperone IbpA